MEQSLVLIREPMAILHIVDSSSALQETLSEAGSSVVCLQGFFGDHITRLRLWMATGWTDRRGEVQVAILWGVCACRGLCRTRVLWLHKRGCTVDDVKQVTLGVTPGESAVGQRGVARYRDEDDKMTLTSRRSFFVFVSIKLVDYPKDAMWCFHGILSVVLEYRFCSCPCLIPCELAPHLPSHELPPWRTMNWDLSTLASELKIQVASITYRHVF